MKRRTMLLLTTIGATLLLASGVALAQATYNQVECGGGNCQGTNGPDQIGGADGLDTIIAKAGDDLVHAGGGKDLVFGLGGTDHLYGGEGEDQLRGGSGKDFIFGGLGHDELLGGPGNDDVVSADDAESDSVYCGPGKDVALVDPEDEVSDDCELVESDGVATPDGTIKAR